MVAVVPVLVSIMLILVGVVDVVVTIVLVLVDLDAEVYAVELTRAVKQRQFVIVAQV